MMIAVLCFGKTENNFDWKQDALILQDIHRGIKSYRLQGYRIGENGVAFISGTKEKAYVVLEKVKNAVEGKYGRDSIGIDTKVLSDAEMNLLFYMTEMQSSLSANWRNIAESTINPAMFPSAMQSGIANLALRGS